jgi:hypothetical protein
MTTQTATTFTIDSLHSTAEFSVKHMMIATVRGRFGEIEGVIRLDEEDPARSSVEATIDAASIDTGVAMRDDDLRSSNFFDVEQYPLIRFRSTSVERIDDERLRERAISPSGRSRARSSWTPNSRAGASATRGRISLASRLRPASTGRTSACPTTRSWKPER